MKDENIKEPKIDMATPLGNPAMILEKVRDFRGTAELVRKILPYYDHALKSISPADGDKSVPAKTASKHKAGGKFAQGQRPDYSHFPPEYENAMIAHLSALQASAFLLEANDKVDRANEVRDVMEALGGMLPVLQSLAQREIPGNAAFANRTG